MDPTLASSGVPSRVGGALDRRHFLAAAGAGTLVALLSGCVGTGSGSSTATTGPTLGAGSPPPASATGTITVWSYVDLKSGPWIQPAITAFNRAYPKVHVNYTYVPYEQLVAKVLGAATTGEGPDGLLFNPSDAPKLNQSGLLSDLTPAWNALSGHELFGKSTVWTVGGKVISVQGYVNTTALWYNKTILDAVGLAVPTTMDEFDAALKAVSAKGYVGFLLGALPTGSGEFDFFPWLLAEGQNYGKWNRSVLTSVFERFGSWLQAGYIPRDITGLNENDNYTRFVGGTTAFCQTGNWELASAKTDIKFDYGVTALPAGTAGSHSVGGGEGVSIMSSAKQPELVWAFFTSALLTKQAQLAVLNSTGDLPSRSDAAADPAVSSDPWLRAYSKVVSDLGTRPATPLISDYLVDMGKVWNAFVGGQLSAASAADEVIKQMTKI
ncbi:MAG TPA: extracellular solute-binding protein [Actinocrinis sp.]|jgi:ABC-type glycerol-3-phosphate transport system substrate-binding protein